MARVPAPTCVKPKELNRFLSGPPKPLLMVDIDGVVSLFGLPDSAGAQPAAAGRSSGTASSGRGSVEGSLHSIEGIPHFLSSTAAAHLHALSPLFDLVWASGWEEKANEHLPRLLGLPAPLPFLRFSGAVGARRSAHAHWKLESIEAYAGERALAWIDDAFNPACHAWAKARPAPTLLVRTEPQDGLTSREAQVLVAWAGELQAGELQEGELQPG